LELQKDNRKIFRAMLIIGIMSFSILFVADNVEANFFEDLAETFDNKLFDGENLEAAELLLSVSILVSIGFVLAIANMNVTGVAIILLCLIGFLTLIGWLETYIIILTVIIIAAFFSKKLADTITSPGSDEN